MRKQREDLTGRKFGMLTVVGRNPTDYVYKGGHEPRWDCICDCQKDNPNPEITTVLHHNLTTGHSWNCGRHNKNKLKDLTGKEFGRLKVIERAPDYINKKGEKEVQWLCQCNCENHTILPVRAHSLLNGHTKSCGCLQREKATKHGGKNTRLYGIWIGMRRRCYDTKHEAYKDYGGRGIKVCDEWKDDFAIFRDWAMSHGYNPDAEFGECTIDRIDPNGNYCPENCRFVSMKVQANNKRNTVSVISNDGYKFTVEDISDMTGIADYTIRARIHRGWTYDQIINTPLNGYMNTLTIEGVTDTLSNFCNEHHMDRRIAYERIFKHGWDPLKALTTPISNHDYTYMGVTGTRPEFDEAIGFASGTITKRMRKGMSFEQAISTPVNGRMSNAVFFIDPDTKKPINQFSDLINYPEYNNKLKTFGELINN